VVNDNKWRQQRLDNKRGFTVKERKKKRLKIMEKGNRCRSGGGRDVQLVMDTRVVIVEGEIGKVE
jgi:hypothetical protein